MSSKTKAPELTTADELFAEVFADLLRPSVSAETIAAARAEFQRRLASKGGEAGHGASKRRGNARFYQALAEKATKARAAKKRAKDKK